MQRTDCKMKFKFSVRLLFVLSLLFGAVSNSYAGDLKITNLWSDNKLHFWVTPNNDIHVWLKKSVRHEGTAKNCTIQANGYTYHSAGVTVKPYGVKQYVSKNTNCIVVIEASLLVGKTKPDDIKIFVREYDNDNRPPNGTTWYNYPSLGDASFKVVEE